VAALTPEGRELRLRLCAHLRRLYEERQFKQRQEMARKLDMDPGHFSALYNGKTEIGLDIAVQLHRVFGESLNHLCDDNPDAKYYPPGTRPGFYLPRADPPPQLVMAAEKPASYPGPDSPQPARHRKKRRT